MTVLRQHDAVLRRRLPGAAVLLPPGADQPVVLTGTALALWDELAEPVDEAGLAARLAERFAVDEATVAADIGPALDRLRQLGAVT
jgi:Coenzyme PQQ synthesis protein D (PqqD)